MSAFVECERFDPFQIAVFCKAYVFQRHIPDKKRSWEYVKTGRKHCGEQVGAFCKGTFPQFQQSLWKDDPFQVQAMPERMVPDVFQGIWKINSFDFPVFRKCFRPDLGRPHWEFHILAGVRKCELPVDRALYMDCFCSIHRYPFLPPASFLKPNRRCNDSHTITSPPEKQEKVIE